MFWEYISIFVRFCCVSWRFRTSYSNTKVSYRFLNDSSLAWGLLFDYKPSGKRSIDTTKYIYGAGTMAALPITIVQLVPLRLSRTVIWFESVWTHRIRPLWRLLYNRAMISHGNYGKGFIVRVRKSRTAFGSGQPFSDDVQSSRPKTPFYNDNISNYRLSSLSYLSIRFQIR